jgi:hypothetical protein
MKIVARKRRHICKSKRIGNSLGNKCFRTRPPTLESEHFGHRKLGEAGYPNFPSPLLGNNHGLAVQRYRICIGILSPFAVQEEVLAEVWAPPASPFVAHLDLQTTPVATFRRPRSRNQPPAYSRLCPALTRAVSIRRNVLRSRAGFFRFSLKGEREVPRRPECRRGRN